MARKPPSSTRSICWDKLAEITSQYVKKGEPLYVEGRLEYRTFEDGDGVERGTVEIVASDVQFLGRRRSKGESDTPEESTVPTDDVSPDDVPF